MRYLPIIVLFALTVNAYSADWVKLPEEKEEYTLFIDKDTIVPYVPDVQYWLKYEYTGLQNFTESRLKYDKELAHVLIRCADKTQTVDKKKFFREGVLIRTANTLPEELTWTPVEPESLNELLMNKYCPETTEIEEPENPEQ